MIFFKHLHFYMQFLAIKLGLLLALLPFPCCGKQPQDPTCAAAKGVLAGFATAVLARDDQLVLHTTTG